jgi:hypothetical protein
MVLVWYLAFDQAAGLLVLKESHGGIVCKGYINGPTTSNRAGISSP